MNSADFTKNKLLTFITTGNPIVDIIFSMFTIWFMSVLSWTSIKTFMNRIKERIWGTSMSVSIECSYTLSDDRGWEINPHVMKNAKLIAAIDHLVSTLNIRSDEDQINLDYLGYRTISAHCSGYFDKLIRVPVYTVHIPNTKLRMAVDKRMTEKTNSTKYTFYHTDHDEIETFLKSSLKKYDEYLDSNKCDSDIAIYIKVPATEQNRRTDTILRYPIFKKDIGRIHFEGKDAIIQLIQDFQAGKSAFPVMSMLLHGPPGTGKTSLIRAIATLTGRSILYVKLSQIESLDQGIEIFHSEKYYVGNCDSTIKLPASKKLIVIEDIDADCLSIIEDRKVKKEEKESGTDFEKLVTSMRIKLTLSDILNLFDGIFNQEETFIMMTTNYPEKIDEALLRPGRVAINLKLGNCTVPMANRIVQNFFPNFEGFVEGDWHFDISPAKLENLCQKAKSVENLIDFLLKEK